MEEVLGVLRSCLASAATTTASAATALHPQEHDLQQDQQLLLQQQAAVVLGSLAYGHPAGLRQLISHGGLPQLVAMLGAADQAVVQAGLRALKLATEQQEALLQLQGGPAAVAGEQQREQVQLRLDEPAMAAVVRCLDAATAPAAQGQGVAGAGPNAAAAASGSGSCGSGDSVRGSVAALAAAVVAAACRRPEEVRGKQSTGLCAR